MNVFEKSLLAGPHLLCVSHAVFLSYAGVSSVPEWRGQRSKGLGTLCACQEWTCQGGQEASFGLPQETARNHYQ